MFCSNCGVKIEGTPKFCPECGLKLIKDETLSKTNEDKVTEPINDKVTNASDEDLLEKLKKLNPLIVASLILLFISFFIDYYGILKYTTLFFSFLGYSQIKKGKGEGKTLAVVCMIVAGVLGFISVIKIIEYAQYSAASYGAIDGVLSWFDDLVY